MKNIRIMLPEPDDWEQSIAASIVYAVVDNYVDFLKMLQGKVRNYNKYGSAFSSYIILSEFEVIMSRKTKSNASAANNGGTNNRKPKVEQRWVWGNCKLTDEDVTALESDSSTLEYLATSLVALGADGFGFTCKPVDSGESHCCTIFRPDFPVVGTTVGVSAFGGNIRDAILSCLYKLDEYGGGDFSGFDLESTASGSKPRFR